MGDTKSAKEARDALIDELKAAFTEYIDAEISRVEGSIDLLEAILKAHNTPTSASKTVIDEITVLAETDFSKFLSG